MKQQNQSRKTYRAAAWAVFYFTIILSLLTVYTFPLWHWSFSIVFAIASLLLILVPVYKPRISSNRTRWLILAGSYAIIIPVFAGMSVACALLIAIEPYSIIFLLAGLLLLIPLSPGRGILRRLLFGAFPAAALTCFILIVASETLQEMPIANREMSDTGNVVIANRTAPDRRYRFALDTNNDYVCFFFPHLRKSEVFSLDGSPVMTLLINGLGISRSVYSPDGKMIFALDWDTGPVVIDRSDFSMKDYRLIELPVKTDTYRYIGIAYHERKQQIIVARANGELITVSYPELKPLKASFDLTGFRWFKEFVQEIYIVEGTDLLVVTTFPGYLIVYDLQKEMVVQELNLFGPLSNVVPSSDRKSLFVAALFTGMIYRIEISSLEITDSFRATSGIRYMTAIPHTQYLAVTNYFNGEVSIIDTKSHEKISGVTVGPRIQWIEAVPGRDSLIVSHALGFTILDSARLIHEKPGSPRMRRFPFFILPSSGAIVMKNVWTIVKDRTLMSLFVAIYAPVLAGALVLLCRSKSNA